ncbi:MAG TPA: peptide deformylase [Candidatus Saccharimonadia bacterium]
MVLEALSQSDPRLRQSCAPVARRDLRDRQQQLEIDALLDFVYGRAAARDVQRGAGQVATPSTVGLSANQVGIMKQICIVDLAIGRPGYHDIRVLVNPRIVWQSKVLRERLEGCVNFPHWWGTTRRPERVKLEALDRSGFTTTVDVTGWAAAVVCHEVDHLHGRLFIDRLVDPKKAHMVTDADYPQYRKLHAAQWDKLVDVSSYAVTDSPA